MKTESLIRHRENALNSTIYMAREILGNNYSLIEWVDEDNKMHAERREGPEFGISELSPHKEWQDLLDSESLWKHLEAPRSSYKSTFITAWAIKEGLRDRDTRVLYVMDTENQAKKKLAAIREHFESNENILKLFGDLKTRKWGAKSFTIKGRKTVGVADPTFQAAGVETNVVGSHFDIVILDDIVQWSNVKTAEGIQKVRDFFSMIMPILDPGARLIVLGTRYADEDIYGTIISEWADRFEILIHNCGMELLEDQSGNPSLEGTPRFPFLTQSFLRSRLATMGMKDFSSQYENVCLSSAQQLFTRSMFRTALWEPWMSGMACYVLTDTATTDDDMNCASVVAVVGVDHRNVGYLLDLWTGHEKPDGFIDKLVSMYSKWEEKVVISKVLMENIGLNQVFRPGIEAECRKRQIRMNIVPVSRSKGALSKNRRIERLQSRFSSGRFVVVTSEGCVPRYYHDHGVKLLFHPSGWKDEDGVCYPDGELVRQFIRFPVTANKDIADAIADIDDVDKAGARTCPVMSTRAKIRSRKKMARRAGTRVKMVNLNGVDIPVDFAPLSEGRNRAKGDPWKRWGRRVS